MSVRSLQALFKFDAFRMLLLGADILAMFGAMRLAFDLVFDGAVPATFQAQQPFLLGIAVASTLSLFSALGVYSRRWPHLGEREVRSLVIAALLASLGAYGAQLWIHPAFWSLIVLFWAVAFVIRAMIGVYASYRAILFPVWQLFVVPLLAALVATVSIRMQNLALPMAPEGLPVSKSIHILYLAISLAFMLGVRWCVHWLFVYYKSPRQRSLQKAILVGDGDELALFTRLNDMSRHYRVMGILDNDPLKWGMRIQQVRVLGGVALLAEVAVQLGAETVLVLRGSLTDAEDKELEKRCRELHLRLVKLGSLHESLLRTDSLSTADLLERQEYRFLPAEQDNYLLGKRVLVTGAGGSIGSELVRQILRCEPALVVLLGRGENSLFELERELATTRKNCPTRTAVVNIADYVGLERCFVLYKPQVVFHAAAHKHVPMMEHNVLEAVRNNVLGTFHVMDLCGKLQVERAVMISTDKAVAPASIMGGTKRRAEQVVANCAACYTNTRYAVVRFGNVLGSRGSVVRIFMDQIRQGGPVTVTDPRMTRYFMTIPEAVSLVLAAASLQNEFGVFVLEMGKPYRIADLAERMIRLCGLEPGKDIRIEYSGVRPGEKLEEVLTAGNETLAPTTNASIRRLDSPLALLDRQALERMLVADEAVVRTWLLETL